MILLFGGSIKHPYLCLAERKSKKPIEINSWESRAKQACKEKTGIRSIVMLSNPGQLFLKTLFQTTNYINQNLCETVAAPESALQLLGAFGASSGQNRQQIPCEHSNTTGKAEHSELEKGEATIVKHPRKRNKPGSSSPFAMIAVHLGFFSSTLAF